MADLTITAANVVPGADAVLLNGTAGETITAGQAFYLEAVSQLFKLADADAVGTAAAVAIALHGASLNQPLAGIKFGSLTLGTAVTTTAAVYVVSTTAGGIAPFADLSSGDFTTVLGIATSTTALKVGIVVGGVAA